jgi:hypothetical protein
VTTALASRPDLQPLAGGEYSLIVVEAQEALGLKMKCCTDMQNVQGTKSPRLSAILADAMRLRKPLTDGNVTPLKKSLADGPSKAQDGFLPFGIGDSFGNGHCPQRVLKLKDTQPRH